MAFWARTPKIIKKRTLIDICKLAFVNTHTHTHTAECEGPTVRRSKESPQKHASVHVVATAVRIIFASVTKRYTLLTKSEKI